MDAFKKGLLTKTPESLVYSFAGDFVGPIINRNAIKALYKNANSKQIQAIFEYEKTILNAYVEVANELSNIQNLKKYMTESGFKREIKLFDAIMIVAGTMIGSGIFIVSSDIARNVGSSGYLLLIWVVTGFITIAGALSYGELAGMFPKAGGQYVYLKEAYNKLIAFLYGWSFFSVIQTGTIAAVGVGFSKFAAYLIPSLRLSLRRLTPRLLVQSQLL